jgi:hypothetical protein
MRKTIAACTLALALASPLVLGGCTNPRDPTQRAVAGGLMGGAGGLAVGNMLGIDPATAGIVGALGGAGTGYITGSERRGGRYPGHGIYGRGGGHPGHGPQYQRGYWTR